MKSQIRKRIASLLALFGTLLCCASASAQVKLYIPDFTVSSYEPVTVSIMLDNSEPVDGFSFRLNMPEELEVVPNSIQKTDRFNQGQTLGMRNNVVNSNSMQGFSFIGNSGCVATFQVKAKPGTLALTAKQVTMRQTSVAIATHDLDNSVKVAEQTTNVTMINSDVKLTLSAAPMEFVINPSGVQEISVAMENNYAVQGMSMNITLPEGFTYVTDGGNIFQQLPRMGVGATIQARNHGNMTRIVIADMENNESLAAGNGEFMRFKVMAPADYAGETAQIVIDNVDASVDFNLFKVNPVTMTLTNGQTAYTKAMGTIASLKEALNAALATIATEAPDVKDNFTGEDIKSEIEALRQAVEAAYADKTLTPNYDTVMAPAAGIEASIAALIDAAKEAQKQYKEEQAAEAARQEAYKNANAVVTGLEQKLAEALAIIATEAPDVKDNFKGEAVSASIANMKNAIDEAYNNKTIVADYDQLVAPAAGIEASIAALIADAKAAQKAFEENARLETARLNANAELSALDAALAEALATIAEECPDVKYMFTGSDIQQQITVLRNAVNTAYDNKTLADDYDTVMAPAAKIREAIAKLVEDAKAEQKKFDDAAAAEKALIEAYNNANAKIADLRTALATALATIAEECPNVKDDFKGEAIDKNIDLLKEAVKDAFDTKTLVENYDNVMAPAAGIESAIAKLIEDAKAAQKAYEEAEAARQAANKAAYEADLATIEQLQADLDKAKATIEELYPGVDYQKDYDAIEDAIEEQKQQADDAYESVADEGVYNNKVDAKTITDLIAKMLEDAKTNGINTIYGEEVTEGDMIFTVDGKRVARLQPGKINIVVKSNGRTFKTYVK